MNINHILLNIPHQFETLLKKFSYVLNNCTLREINHLLEPYKQNSSKTVITTPTRIVHCYNRTQKLLPSLHLDSQHITQSSKAIQSTLETINTIFNSINLQQISLQVIQISLIFLFSDTLWGNQTLICLTGNIFVTFLNNLQPIFEKTASPLKTYNTSSTSKTYGTYIFLVLLLLL